MFDTVMITFKLIILV